MTTAVVNPTTYHTPAQIRSATIAWDNTGIGTLVAVCPLAIGEIVKGIAVEIPTAWNSVTSDTMTVGIAKADGTSPTPLATFNAQTASAPVGSALNISTAPATLGNLQGRAIVACEVYVKVVSVGGSLSAGVATVYVTVHTADAAGVTYSPTPTQTVSTGEVAGYKS